MVDKEEKVLFSEIEDLVKTTMDKTIKSFFKDKVYNPKDNDFFIKHINDKLSKEFVKISTNFKYIISLILLRNEDSGFTQNTIVSYDEETDGCVIEKYVFSNIICVANIFCFAI